MHDMLTVKELAAHPLDHIQEARCDLADWYLIEQSGDLMYLPRFFEAYFREQLSQQEGRFNHPARDYAMYALDRATALNQQLAAMSLDNSTNREKHVGISGEIFRYAIPCGRLLRAIGENALADRLPIQVKGTLREMVFHFYQIERNYPQALAYADRWLALNPHDLEILLYRIRCYRNIGGQSHLATAEKLLRWLEGRAVTKSFSARLCREKALIAERRGSMELAKTYFRQGIDNYTVRGYPDNHVGLAQLLLREIDESSLGVQRNQELAREALQCLEIGRDLSATFDRVHLGIYIEALVQVGYDDTALPLLEVALQDRPDDSRLNYRMAEILRKRDHFKEAERYARKAVRAGANRARLTLANIYCGWALKFESDGQLTLAEGRRREALEAVNQFTPEYGHDQEVADGLASKVLRALAGLYKLSAPDRAAAEVSIPIHPAID
jgi:tetratricopeptide (TPR) repeat protein